MLAFRQGVSDFTITDCWRLIRQDNGGRCIAVVRSQWSLSTTKMRGRKRERKVITVTVTSRFLAFS
eukprot:scaffold15281_cov109-Skeletonema_dohrnii-CCMP3373.AAC.4